MQRVIEPLCLLVFLSFVAFLLSLVHLAPRASSFIPLSLSLSLRLHSPIPDCPLYLCPQRLGRDVREDRALRQPVRLRQGGAARDGEHQRVYHERVERVACEIHPLGVGEHVGLDLILEIETKALQGQGLGARSDALPIGKREIYIIIERVLCGETNEEKPTPSGGESTYFLTGPI